MKKLAIVLFLVAAPALADEKQKAPPAAETVVQKPVYRTLDKMLKGFSRAAQAKLVATR